MTLQLLHSEFPYIWGKFDFLFYQCTLQMKGRWESNINAWFRFMYIPRNETARPHYFQNIIIMFCLPIFTFMYLWAIYIFPGPVCLLGCSKIGRLSCDTVPLRSWASVWGVGKHNTTLSPLPQLGPAQRHSMIW
jgi:hypothetical protein